MAGKRGGKGGNPYGRIREHKGKSNGVSLAAEKGHREPGIESGKEEGGNRKGNQ